MGNERIVDVGRGWRTPSSPASFEDFFLEHHDRLYKALFVVTGNSADTEDIAQEALLKVWERWDRIQRIDDPTGYLFRVGLNSLRSRIRRTHAARQLAPVTAARDPFDEVELHEDVRRLLLGPPPRQRAALVLTQILGFDSQQAAQILGV